MKLLQRTLSILLAVCLVFSLVACGKKQKAPTTAPTTVPTTDVPTADTTDPDTSATDAPTADIPDKETDKFPTRPSAQASNKATTNKPNKTPAEAPDKVTTKATGNTPTVAPNNAATKETAKAPNNVTTNTPTKATTKSPTKTTTNSPTKAPATTPAKATAATPATASTTAATQPKPGVPSQTTPSGILLHLIRNADGSYGGSLSEAKYGKGAPLNGQYNVKNSDYYTVNNDYYNMPSTSERVIIPKFSPYQQTMQDSSGLACLMMILNYMGEDVQNKYTELALLQKYEEVNGTTVYGKGTTEEGLIKLVNALNLGYTATNTCFKFSGTSESTREKDTKDFFINSIKEGKFILVRYQSPVGYGWKVIIGYDNLGNIRNTATKAYTDAFGDDVIIFAEPYDGFDHCQDGYATERAQDFYVWWKDMSTNGTITTDSKWTYVLIDPNLDVTYDYQPVDETVKQTLYDLHLPLNPDGTYGATRNYSLYGSITSGKGWWNHTESNYYKINDFYNMGSKGSRILLKNYTVLQQTMHSSCGICAINSVLKNYGGEEESYYDMELSYLNDYERINAAEGPVKGRGTSTAGNVATLAEWGYTAEYGYAAQGSLPKHSTYEAYSQFIRTNLLEGRPIVVSTYLGSGHYLTVIGFDDMGTDYIYDDVIITADSCDYWDGYQDGYNVFSATKFFRQHTNSGHKWLQTYIVVNKNQG